MCRIPHSRRWLVAAATLAAAALVAAPAGAAPSCSSLTPALYATVTCSYNTAGTAVITVPAGTGSISIDLYGASGAGGSGGVGVGGGGANGGSGARVQAVLDRIGLTTIAVAVGAGGSTSGMGGDGGGFVALYAGSSASDPAMVVAGGGGGGPAMNGSGPVGGNGAATGIAAGQAGVSHNSGATGGAGGANGTGGAGGIGCSSQAGSSWASGGSGGARFGNGGGGGAGYGGGGGGCGSGGGAGGSYADPSRLIGAATYEPSPFAGGAGGTGLGSVTAGANGFASVTFHPQSLTVTYAGNGATGGDAPAAATQDYGTTVTVATAGTLARTGYAFAGWNTSADGSSTAYAAGATFTLTSGQTLYAQWRSEPAASGSTTSGSTAAKPVAVTLVTTAPRVTPAGPEVSFSATGPGTARISGTTTARTDSAICSGTVKVLKASRVSIVCRLTATGRRLRAKAPLTIVLTTTFTAKGGAVHRATRTVVLPRRA